MGLVDFQWAAIDLVYLLAQDGRFFWIGSGFDDAAVVDHACDTPDNISAPTESEKPDLMVLGEVVDDEAVYLDAFFRDGRAGGAIPDIFQKCLVEANTFLIACNSVGMVCLDGMHFRWAHSRLGVPLDFAHHGGQGDDIAEGVRLSAAPRAIAEYGNPLSTVSCNHLGRFKRCYDDETPTLTVLPIYVYVEFGAKSSEVRR